MIKNLLSRFWWAPVIAFLAALAKEPLAVAAACTLAGLALSYLERVLSKYPVLQQIVHSLASVLPGAVGHATQPSDHKPDVWGGTAALFLTSLTPEQRAGLTVEQRVALEVLEGEP